MKIGITGCAGRMGRALIKTVLETKTGVLAGGTALADDPSFDVDLGVLGGFDPIGIKPTTDPAELFAASDVIIDFTLPTATSKHLELAASRGVALVLGTTGLSPEQDALMQAVAEQTAIFRARNFSLGVNLLAALVEQAAARLDPALFDIDVLEMHHKHKVDAPSGTALMLGEAAADGRKVDFDKVAVLSREGHTGEREEGTIGFATLRGGDVTGDHTVIFASPGERIELSHKASDRIIYARGAVQAAKWVNDKAPGLYSMQDILEL